MAHESATTTVPDLIVSSTTSHDDEGLSPGIAHDIDPVPPLDLREDNRPDGEREVGSPDIPDVVITPFAPVASSSERAVE